ncbi:uncharacterized protein BX663DRAFT_551308 [Cokeromyces recurvatus]|uniref:uncharacterized protein n=1 Tax=Cokeromyces recurvatus TaxID=90255 RepID=UPI00221E5440|nr:uncharacterized protein BX663DRAFT_551308 [Cokeromyces recurvatus]KAI7903613.1 hypothetical protein BX663DRAFT_551308 [Cokeromyces recurvatus]
MASVVLSSVSSTIAPNSASLSGCNSTTTPLPSGVPVISNDDLLPKKDNKNKKSKDKKKKASKKDSSVKKSKESKPIRQAVGVIVIDPATQKILMLESKKKKGTYVLPRDDCKTKPTEEHPEQAALRLLHEKAGVSTSYLSARIGSYSQANKKGKITAHHWMYEVHGPTLLKTWPNSNRQRVWVSYEEALKATENKRMSHLALERCSLARTIIS